MDKLSSQRLGLRYLVIIGFFLLWLLILLVDYTNKHYGHVLSFIHFRYFILVGLAAGLIGSLFFINRLIESKTSRFHLFTPLGLLVQAPLYLFIIGFSFKYVTNQDVGINLIGYMSLRATSYLIMLIPIVIGSYSLGDWIMDKWLKKYQNFSIKVALGLAVICTMLFVLAALGLFSTIPCWLVILLPVVLNYKKAISTLKSFASTSIVYDSRNPLVFCLASLTWMFILLNALSILAPFPFGFDSRNFYANIAQLVADNQAIVEGFQPYSWSLLMATGYALYNSPEVMHLISLLGMMLSIIPIISLSRKHFELAEFESQLVILLFVFTPAIFNQMFVELKIDFGLLFVQLSILVLMFQGYSEKSEEVIEETKDIKSLIRPWSFFILLGILNGFALSIKFTHLYLIFALVVFLWVRHVRELGLLISATGLVGALMLFGLDDISGLKVYHLSGDSLKWALILSSVLMGIVAFRTKKSRVLAALYASVLVGLFMIPPISPWIVKNYTETKSLSPRILLLGREPGSTINLIRNYEKLNGIR